MDVTVNISFGSTVVPALGDSSRDRPYDVYGHVINGPTHLYVKLPAIGGHLPNADVDIYWLSVPAITDSANNCHVFDGHFNPKSLEARTLS